MHGLAVEYRLLGPADRLHFRHFCWLGNRCSSTRVPCADLENARTQAVFLCRQILWHRGDSRDRLDAPPLPRLRQLPRRMSRQHFTRLRLGHGDWLDDGHGHVSPGDRRIPLRLWLWLYPRPRPWRGAQGDEHS